MSNQEIEELIGDIAKGIWGLLVDIGTGIMQLPKKRSRIYTIAGMLLGILILYRFRVGINQRFIPVKYHYISMHFEALLIVPSVYLYILGSTWKDYIKSFERSFESVGLYSNLQRETRAMNGSTVKKRDYPKYIKEKKEGKCTVYYFTSNGISLDDWRKKQQQLEPCMNCHIVKVEQEQHTKKYVKVYTMKATDCLKDNYRWMDEYIYEKDFEIVLGEGLLGRVKINFEDIPHLLVAGETGSGKSVLTNSIIWQIIYKGARVFLIDFKGGIELDHFKEFGPVMWDRKKVIEVLKMLIQEHEKRVELFKSCGVKKLSEYNKGVGESGKLSRVVIVIDEAAELLDKDGAEDDEEAEITLIERMIKKLARLARAQGIHIIMATQRPDTKVITGQIRNNLPGRISGKMTDKEPSMMALGSPKAVDLPDIKGRFLYKAGVDMHEFQAYYFKTTDIKKGSYVKGKLLLDGGDKSAGNIGSNAINIEEAEENGLINTTHKTKKVKNKESAEKNSLENITETKEKVLTEDKAAPVQKDEVVERQSDEKQSPALEDEVKQFKNFVSDDDY